MKKYLSIISITLLSIATLFNCNDEDAAPKDYAASIKDKTWWGTLTNSGEAIQYYSVHFNAGNSLVWSQLSGDYLGQWSLDKNKLTITFTAPAVIVTTEISDDNTWVNITTNTSNIVNSGELVANPNITLDNTEWNGVDISGGVTKSLKLIFTPNLEVSTVIDNKGAGGVPYNYTRLASGGAIRITAGYPYFGVITAGGELRGSRQSYINSWQATKQ